MSNCRRCLKTPVDPACGACCSNCALELVSFLTKENTKCLNFEVCRYFRNDFTPLYRWLPQSHRNFKFIEPSRLEIYSHCESCCRDLPHSSWGIELKIETFQLQWPSKRTLFPRMSALSLSSKSLNRTVKL